MGSPPRVRKETPDFPGSFWRDHSEYKDTAMRGVACDVAYCRCCFQIHVRSQGNECTRLATHRFAIYANTGALAPRQPNLLRSIAHVREMAQAAIVVLAGLDKKL